MNTTPSLKKTRVTVPVSPEVHEAFRRLADASGISVGRAMGDWLQDTTDAAEAMTAMVLKARQQPKLAIREIQGYTLGLNEVTQDLISALTGVKNGVTPPVSNTGGKLSKKSQKGGAQNEKNKN